MIDQLLYNPTYKTKVELSKSSYQNPNPWSMGKTKKIEVLDFFFNMRIVQWKGVVQTVEYDLMMMMLKQWRADGMSREEALDLMFDI